MKSFTSQHLLAVAGAAALLLTATANAASINTTLDRLVLGGSDAGGITIGDKRYSGFTFDSTGDAPVAPNAVGVSLVSSDDDNRYQIRFSFIQDPLDANAGQATDVVIGYRIDVLGPQLINRVGLAFDGSAAGGSGDAAASVVETIRSTIAGVEVSPAFPGLDDIEISVLNINSGTLPDSNNFTLAVNPTQSLEFVKDINVSSRAGGGRVVINTVDNFVDQVPEPGSVALLAAAGTLLMRRRRSE